MSFYQSTIFPSSIESRLIQWILRCCLDAKMHGEE